MGGEKVSTGIISGRDCRLQLVGGCIKIRPQHKCKHLCICRLIKATALLSDAYRMDSARIGLL